MRTTCDVQETVKVSIPEIINAVKSNDEDGFFDMLAEKTGHPLLMDINYTVLSINEDQSLNIEVTGCVEVEDEDGTKPPAAP